MPRSLPFLRLSFLRLAKLAWSEISSALLNTPGEIAAVIGDAGGRRERHLRRLDEVALAQASAG